VPEIGKYLDPEEKALAESLEAVDVPLKSALTPTRKRQIESMARAAMTDERARVSLRESKRDLARSEQELILIARELSYKETDRLRTTLAEREKGENRLSIQLLNEVLSNSINDVYALLFLPDRMIQITPHGISLSIALRSFRGADNYLLLYPSLTEKFLRQAFTGFEFVVYKLSQLRFENNRHDYKWETESTRARLRRLFPVLASSACSAASRTPNCLVRGPSG
jgi:hypothetical protein